MRSTAPASFTSIAIGDSAPAAFPGGQQAGFAQQPAAMGEIFLDATREGRESFTDRAERQHQY